VVEGSMSSAIPARSPCSMGLFPNTLDFASDASFASVVESPSRTHLSYVGAERAP
jgi:hypothetical protein